MRQLHFFLCFVLKTQTLTTMVERMPETERKKN
jgi:hypothetical protein